MSAIRPDLPAVTPQAAGDAPAVRNAQAAFFRAAMAQVQAPQPQIASAPRTVQTTVTPTSTTSAEPTRMARPGSLLDIRV